MLRADFPAPLTDDEFADMPIQLFEQTDVARFAIENRIWNYLVSLPALDEDRKPRHQYDFYTGALRNTLAHLQHQAKAPEEPAAN
ncbi:hypothetical protein [Streptomyces sp. NPDC056160]|uniref:hypothetical protein n=1 Tax=Streptomyces sp. NPDC056160 TaxID=3345731 RepID=UPI0035E0C3D6